VNNQWFIFVKNRLCQPQSRFFEMVDDLGCHEYAIGPNLPNPAPELAKPEKKKKELKSF